MNKHLPPPYEPVTHISPLMPEQFFPEVERRYAIHADEHYAAINQLLEVQRRMADVRMENSDVLPGAGRKSQALEALEASLFLSAPQTLNEIKLTADQRAAWVQQAMFNDQNYTVINQRRLEAERTLAELENEQQRLQMVIRLSSLHMEHLDKWIEWAARLQQQVPSYHEGLLTYLGNLTGKGGRNGNAAGH